MEEDDAGFGEMLVYYAFGALVPAILCLVGLATICPKQRLYAYFVDITKRIMEQKLAGRKEQLFQPLSELVSSDVEFKKNGAIRILEIGSGPGCNFKYYPDKSHLVCYDPNPYFRSYLYLSHTYVYYRMELDELVVAGGENLYTVKDGTMDAVVITLALCSVQDKCAVLKEILRVLAPGGKFFFIEHIHKHVHTSPGIAISLLLGLVRSLWEMTFGKFHNRDSDTLLAINNAGFSSVELQYFQIKWEKKFYILNFLNKNFVAGTAVK